MKFLPHAQRQNFVNQQLSDWISSKLDQELSPHHDSKWNRLFSLIYVVYFVLAVSRRL